MVIFVCTLIEYSDWEDRMLSKIGDTKLDNDRFLLEMHNSMIEMLFFSDDTELILDSKLFDFVDEYKQ